MKRIYIPLLMALAITSCQDNTVEPEALVHDNVMRFNLVGPNSQTKVTAGAFEAADQIGLYVADYVNDATPMPLQISGNRANNSLVTFDGVTWTPEQTIYWGTGKSDVYAYYPYLPEISDVNSQYFEVCADQTAEGYEASDFLWAKAVGVRQTDGTVNLEMKHLMSKLTVKIVAGEDYIGSLPEDASVLLHSTVTGTKIDLENGSVVKDPYSGAKSIKMRNLGIRTFADGQKAVVYEAIVVPQMLESSVPLLEINSKSVSYLLEDSFNFRPGVAYTYTATLNTSTTAIKVEIGCELEDWNSGGGDSGSEGDGGEGDGGESGDDDSAVYVDLSAAGTANCYLVQQSGDYKFKAVIGNSDATVGNVKIVEVLWESFGTDEMPNVGDLVASVSYKDGYIRFSTPKNFRDGNAVIAAKNSKGTILWSWHIWCAEEGWQEQVYPNDAGVVMDRNLGSFSASPGAVQSLGLLYCRNQKDPYRGFASISSNILSLCVGKDDYSGSLQPSALWNIVKSIQDPCPNGWRIPSRSIFESLEFSKSDYDSKNKGFNVQSTIWYPCAGRLYCNGGKYMQVGDHGWYWHVEYSSRALYLLCSGSSSFSSCEHTWTDGDRLSVRCQKE